MSSEDKVTFNDSSGGADMQIPVTSSKNSKVVPEALELGEMNPILHTYR